jgi:hypothetical protein
MQVQEVSVHCVVHTYVWSQYALMPQLSPAHDSTSGPGLGNPSQLAPEPVVDGADPSTTTLLPHAAAARPTTAAAGPAASRILRHQRV